jgi:hypothetical protein
LYDLIPRWFNNWGLSMQSEKKDSLQASEQELGEICVENVPFVFQLKNGKETEVRPAACPWLRDLKSAALKMIHENQK